MILKDCRKLWEAATKDLSFCLKRERASVDQVGVAESAKLSDDRTCTLQVGIAG